MLGRKKIKQQNEMVRKGDSLGSAEQLKYNKPKILAIDCNEVGAVLRSEGFNVRSGSFGRPYRIEKGDGYLPVIVSPILPNHAEQEIVIVDLAAKGPAEEPDLMARSFSVHQQIKRASFTSLLICLAHALGFAFFVAGR